jgi:hypothetical protein
MSGLKSSFRWFTNREDIWQCAGCEATFPQSRKWYSRWGWSSKFNPKTEKFEPHPVRLCSRCRDNHERWYREGE